MQIPSPNRLRRPALLGVLLFLIVVGINALGASYVATEGDAVQETSLVGDPESPRPNHLLQTRAFRLASKSASALHLRAAPFIPLQLLNAVLGGVAAVLVLVLLTRAGLRLFVAFGFSLVWALSWGVWFHSRTAETGVTPLPFLLGAFALLLPADPLCSPGRCAKELSAGRAALASFLFAGSILLSFTTILLAPAFLISILFSSAGVRRLLSASAILVLLVSIPYLFAAHTAGIGPTELVSWITHHPDDPGIPKGGAFGFLRSIAGLSRVVFPVSGAETAIKAKLLDSSIEVGATETISLARNLAATGLLGAFALAGGWKLRRSVLGIVAMAAILPTAVFSTYWLGSDPQFWLPVYAFILLLAAAGSAGRVPLLGAALAVVIAFMYWTNVAYGPPSPLYPSGDARWRTASTLARDLSPHALILRPGVTASPLEFVDDLRPDVEVLNLSYSPPRDLRGEAVLGWLADIIESARATRREVWFEGIADPLPSQLLGSWTFTAGTRRVSRGQIRDFLMSRYGIGPAAAEYSALSRVGAD